jgi:hypothetical protein
MAAILSQTTDAGKVRALEFLLSALAHSKLRLIGYPSRSNA